LVDAPASSRGMHSCGSGPPRRDRFKLCGPLVPDGRYSNNHSVTWTTFGIQFSPGLIPGATADWRRPTLGTSVRHSGRSDSPLLTGRAFVLPPPGSVLGRGGGRDSRGDDYRHLFVSRGMGHLVECPQPGEGQGSRALVAVNVRSVFGRCFYPGTRDWRSAGIHV